MVFVRKWYTADFHFGHAAMLTMLPETRAFATVEEMDRRIIEVINERVSKTDMLYILGDFALTKDDAYVRHCFHSLNGKKHLIIGNHDVDRDGNLKPVLAKLPWEKPPVLAMQTNDEGKRLFLNHYAMRVWPGQHKGAVHFYGHSHGRLPAMGRSRDVGLDCPDMGFGPLTYNDLAAGLPVEQED